MDTEQIKKKYLEIYKDEYFSIIGPYVRPDGRKYLGINKHNGKRTTTQWCRAIMTVLKNRKLSQSETVDHKDRDITNDSPNNLQILPRNIHGKKDAKYRKTIIAECIWCNCEFEMDESRVSTMRTRKMAGPFCSRSCAGKYGSSVQNGKIEKIENYTQYEVNYEYREL